MAFQRGSPGHAPLIEQALHIALPVRKVNQQTGRTDAQ